MPVNVPPLTLALALALLLALLALQWQRGGTSRANRRRGRRAARAERDAERLLQRAGYEVIERQVTGTWPMLVDGEAIEARLRADLVVARDGLLFIAEVKSGAEAPRPTHPQTRRQLLEYLLAFEVDGVLLVDMEQRRVLEVAFPTLSLA